MNTKVNGAGQNHLSKSALCLAENVINTKPNSFKKLSCPKMSLPKI